LRDHLGHTRVIIERLNANTAFKKPIMELEEKDLKDLDKVAILTGFIRVKSLWMEWVMIFIQEVTMPRVAGLTNLMVPTSLQAGMWAWVIYQRLELTLTGNSGNL